MFECIILFIVSVFTGVLGFSLVPKAIKPSEKTGIMAFQAWWPVAHPSEETSEFSDITALEIVDEDTVIINGDTFVKQ